MRLISKMISLPLFLALAGCNQAEIPSQTAQSSSKASEVKTAVTTTSSATAKIPAKADFDRMVIKLKTGDVVIRLRPDLAPKHVARVKKLTKEGFYNGIVFHRVIAGFMAQTGDPTGTGTGGSKYPNLPAEFSSEPFVRGTIGAARAGDPNSANSQFFITFAPSRFLDGQYTVWGNVITGMEHVDQIKKGHPRSGSVNNPDKMISVKWIDASK